MLSREENQRLHFLIQETVETVGCIEVVSGTGEEGVVTHEPVTSRTHESTERWREERTSGGEAELLNLRFLESLCFGSAVLKPNLNLCGKRNREDL
jgi:hypothetical protein